MKRMILLGVSAMFLGGCASIVKGTSQDVAVGTNPQGARCELVRAGEKIGVVEPTPGVLKIAKNSSDIQITCTMAGFDRAQYVLASGTEMMAAGNVIFGGLIGLAIDAGSGAMNKYDSNVTVVMHRSQGEGGAEPSAPVVAGQPAQTAASNPAPTTVVADAAPAPREEELCTGQGYVSGVGEVRPWDKVPCQ